MPKAILELEMPKNCWECELYSTVNNCCNVIVIVGHYAICPSKGRRADCPLKLADEHCRKAEWVNGKCRGFQVSRWNYDSIPKCKNCKDFEEYKEVEP